MVMNKGLQKHILERKLEKQGIERDLIDTDSYLDDTLTLSENIGNFQSHGFLTAYRDYSDEEIDYYNKRNNYVCMACGNGYTIDIKRYPDGWTIVKCRKCGWWNTFFDKEGIT